MGYEGIISRTYFSALGGIVPEDFKFEKRSKMPPRDPFNSMLSLGYSMLFNEILSDLIAVGLHPYVGFMHKIAKGHPVLASDLIDCVRIISISIASILIVKASGSNAVNMQVRS